MQNFLRYVEGKQARSGIIVSTENLLLTQQFLIGFFCGYIVSFAKWVQHKKIRTVRDHSGKDIS